ncbi:prephenate dehydrogenase/arogenate dehydrogenase family protein [Paraconexibacter sp. AEG42_29]|uniref:prephenate dehydrogenase/arogenate dehydrogenase family protein n=1 Tax=Paraconexibacter sp. AEG42_29 TaxID=2997339 RepID=UPI00339D3DE9
MHVAVLGVGLIGGSVALAARRQDGVRVTGWDASPDALERALAAGVIDDTVPDVASLAGQGVDVCVVAVPLGALAATVAAACAATAQEEAIVTDVGSTKLALVTGVPAATYIGGHPLAGAETSGVEHARGDLFDGATWYLTPSPESSGFLFERLRRFVASLGAVPVAIDAGAHDRLMAAVSHLPHVLANIMVQQAAAALGGETLPATGPSFRDATRVAGANPLLWGQIYSANAAALADQIDATIAALQDVRGRLHDLEAWQAEVSGLRRALLEVGLDGGPQQELRVSVPNVPGVVADLAVTLGHAGINISDMSLAPSQDRQSGVVGVWVAAADADRARHLITAKDLPVT